MNELGMSTSKHTLKETLNTPAVIRATTASVEGNSSCYCLSFLKHICGLLLLLVQLILVGE